MNTRPKGSVGDGPVEGGMLSVGAVLGDTYRIVRPLAEGGCGEVYVAAHARLPSEVAIKILHRTLARDAQALARFRQEAEITSALRHPHIVQMFDFNVTEQGIPYLVMELLAGRLLASDMVPDRPLEPRAALRIIEQIAQALQFAHDRGIVHRDLKPETVILLSVDGLDDFVKVLDFGISQASWRTRLTGEPIVAGTPQYMAPEQACGLRDAIDHRADQFSLAAIAYRMLTGREPFGGDDVIAVLHQVVHAQPSPPSSLAPRLGAEVDVVIGRGLSKEPADRHPSITAFAEALREAVAAMEPVRAPATSPASVAVSEQPEAPAALVTERLIRKTRRRIPSRRTGSVLLTLAAAAAFAWFSPATRRETRSTWRQVSADASRMLEAVAQRARQESPRSSAGVSIP